MAGNATVASASRPLLEGAILKEYRFKSIAFPAIKGYLRMYPGDFCKIFQRGRWLSVSPSPSIRRPLFFCFYGLGYTKARKSPSGSGGTVEKIKRANDYRKGTSSSETQY
jgi:hypothetical protein